MTEPYVYRSRCFVNARKQNKWCQVMGIWGKPGRNWIDNIKERANDCSRSAEDMNHCLISFSLFLLPCMSTTVVGEWSWSLEGFSTSIFYRRRHKNDMLQFIQTVLYTMEDTERGIWATCVVPDVSWSEARD